MKRTIEKGRTFLVDGPACVSLLAGEVEVFGASFEIGAKAVIREGKRVAFEVKQKAQFDLRLAENASVEECEGSTIPVSWEKACNSALALKEKPVIVMVMGEVDSGKTSFCTYLANMALKEKHKVAIIDADLGQSDIGPPGTIGFCRFAAPMRDPFLLKAEDAYFIGTTTPSGALNKVVDKVARMKDKGLRRAIDFLVINTDGWVLGEEAVRYKLRLTRHIEPSLVVGIQQQDELTPLLSVLKGIKAVSIDSPPAIKKRDREKRKILRELSYKKYLKEAKVQSFSLSKVKSGDFSFGKGATPDDQRLEKVRTKLGVNPLYCEETPNSIVIISGKNQQVDEEQINNLEEELGKKVNLMREGEEQGLLVGLHGDEEKFLGIGILSKIDYERHIIQVYTPVTADIASILVGQVKLDRQGRELRVSPVKPSLI